MIAAPVVALLLAATPSILVVPAAPAARPACEGLVDALSGEKVKIKLAGEKSEAVACMKRSAADGRVACLVDALSDAKVDAVLLVSAAGKPASTILTLQLISRTGETERKETVRGAAARVAINSRPAISRTIQTLRAVLLIEETHAIQEKKPEPVVPPPDTPIVEKPAPSPVAELNLKPTPPAPVEPAPVVRARPVAAAWALTAFAIVGAGVGGTFGTMGYFGKRRVEITATGISELSYLQAAGLRDRTNLEFTIALAAGITAVVTALIAGILWAQ